MNHKWKCKKKKPCCFANTSAETGHIGSDKSGFVFFSKSCFILHTCPSFVGLYRLLGSHYSCFHAQGQRPLHVSCSMLLSLCFVYLYNNNSSAFFKLLMFLHLCSPFSHFHVFIYAK